MAAPREGGPVGLAELSSMLWDANPVSLVVGREVATLAAGSRYLPLPPGRPRVLVPLEGRRAAAGSVVANPALRRRSERVMRRLLAWSLRFGMAQRASTAWWEGVVSPEGDLLGVLREHWREDVSGLGIAVRTYTPNYKPTFVAVDRKGRCLGFGKIAANDGAHERLDVEIQALRSMEQHPAPGLATPRLLADVRWSRCRIAVAEPLPADASRYPTTMWTPLPLLRKAIASGASRRLSALLSGLLERVAASGDQELSEVAAAYAERLTEDLGDVALAVGRTHGDWVPWNLALGHSTVWAWDWEHSEPDGVPAVDIAIWHYLVAQFQQGLPTLEALDESSRRTRLNLARVGLPPEEVEAVVRISTLHLAARAASLYRSSGIWREGSRQGLLGALGFRT